MCRRNIRILKVLCSKLIRNLHIDSDSETDCDRIDKVLHRIYQRQCRHRLFTDLCHKKAVHDIVQ